MTKISREEAFKRHPKTCESCNGENIQYWDETDEEVVFHCLDCGRYYPIHYDTIKLHFYFAFKKLIV